MIVAVDSSVLVASLTARERYHVECESVLFDHDCRIYVHALAETFNTLTGNRLGYRSSLGHRGPAQRKRGTANEDCASKRA